MKQNRHSGNQIIAKLRQADVELRKGKKVSELCHVLEITEYSHSHRRPKFVRVPP